MRTPRPSTRAGRGGSPGIPLGSRRMQSGGLGKPEAAVETPEGVLDAAPALEDGEIVLLALRPSRWLLMANLLGSLLIVGLALWAAVRVFGGTGAGAPGPSMRALALVGGLAVLAWLPVAAWFMMDWRTHRYVLTNRRVLSMVGMVRPFVAEAPLAAVRRVELVRTPWSRPLRIGTVRFVNPHGLELVRWSLVSRPVEVRRTVLEALHRYGRGDVEEGESEKR